jgi:hypothetical protein
MVWEAEACSIYARPSPYANIVKRYVELQK